MDIAKSYEVCICEALYAEGEVAIHSLMIDRHIGIASPFLLLLYFSPDLHVQQLQALGEQLPTWTSPTIWSIIIPIINSDWKQII